MDTQTVVHSVPQKSVIRHQKAMSYQAVKSCEEKGNACDQVKEANLKRLQNVRFWLSGTLEKAKPGEGGMSAGCQDFQGRDGGTLYSPLKLTLNPKKSSSSSSLHLVNGDGCMALWKY